jgi:adenine phosphoribosyltransferase
MGTQEDPRISYVNTKIKSYSDFPKKGIDFKDLFSAMRDPKALVYLIELVKEKSKQMKGLVDCVVGLDSRGFLFGPIMAAEIGVAFVPVSNMTIRIWITNLYSTYIVIYCHKIMSKHFKQLKIIIYVFDRFAKKVNFRENAKVSSMH